MLSTIYGAVAARRRRQYDERPGARKQLERPVVSIGALAAGGRGKTPVAAHVAQLLRDAGERPAILSRGYRRRTRADGVVVVRAAAQVLASVDVAGDEPRMLAQQVLNTSVLVSEDRYLAGRLAEASLGVTVHILDDGFQHLPLARSVDLVLVDPDDPDRKTLPFGPLRERPETARVADALIVDAPDDETAAAAAARLGVRTWFRLTRSTGSAELVGAGGGIPPEHVLAPGDRVVAAAGIADPERFATMARDAGYEVTETVAFPDHHRFTRRDLEKLAERARSTGAEYVLTTEKDAARLEPMAPFPVTIATLPLTVSVEPAHRFRDWLLARVAAAGDGNARTATADAGTIAAGTIAAGTIADDDTAGSAGPVAAANRGRRVLVRHRVEYALVQAFRGMVRIVPRRASLAVGSVLGALFHRLHASRREVGADNLRAVFPEMTEAERRAILRATFRQIGRHVIDFLNFDAMSRERMMPLVDMEGTEHVERAQAEGRGVMYFAGHYGSWELQIMVHALNYKPITMLARRLDNLLLERLIEKIRTRVGTRVLPRQGAMRGLLRAMRDGGSVGMMIDQHISDRSAIRLDFLGRPASTTTAIVSLALRFDAPIIPVFALPQADGRYRMVYEPPIEPPDDDDPDPVRTCTRRCAERLEARIRSEPHLWLWMHRRWR